jgi:septal ring factor EnvC (AmiA/AmiB activator)
MTALFGNLQDKLNSLRKTREGIQQDYEKYMTALKSKLDFAKEHRFTQQAIDKLEAEIKTAKKIYLPDLDQLDAEIALLDKAISSMEQKEAQEQAKRAGELEALRKGDALRAWVRAGGDPNAFEEAWPTIYQERLANQVVDEINEDPGRAAHQQIIKEQF